MNDTITTRYSGDTVLTWIGATDQHVAGPLEFWLDYKRGAIHWVNIIHNITYLVQVIDFPADVTSLRDRIRYCVTHTGMARYDNYINSVYRVYATDLHTFYLDGSDLKHFVQSYSLSECVDRYKIHDTENDTLQDILDRSRATAKIIAVKYRCGQPRKDFPILT